MGAWGAGSFENDAALDFASEIESVDDVKAGLAAEGQEEIDADLGSRVIVAAECVAAMRGHRNPDMPADLAERVHGLGKPSIALFDTARNNLSAVMSRGVAGVRGRSFVINFPGSKGGVKDGITVIDDLLEHIQTSVEDTTDNGPRA